MTKDEELIEREATARAIEGLKWAPCQTIDDAIAFIASAIRNDRVFPAADRLEALARPVVGVEGLSMLSAMLDTDIAREGPMASFMIRAGLLREILDCLSALAASPSPAPTTDWLTLDEWDAQTVEDRRAFLAGHYAKIAPVVGDEGRREKIDLQLRRYGLHRLSVDQQRQVRGFADAILSSTPATEVGKGQDHGE